MIRGMSPRNEDDEDGQSRGLSGISLWNVVSSPISLSGSLTSADSSLSLTVYSQQTDHRSKQLMKFGYNTSTEVYAAIITLRTCGWTA